MRYLLILILGVSICTLNNAAPAWAEENSVKQNNSKFWEQWTKLKASQEWKSLKKATVIDRKKADAKTDKEKAFDKELKKLQAHAKASADKAQSAEAPQEGKELDKETIKFLSQPIPPFTRSARDKKTQDQDDDMAWLMKEALSESPKFKQKVKEMKEKEDKELLQLVLELDKLPPLKPAEGYDKVLLEISKIQMDKPDTPGLDDAWAYIKGMKDADAIKHGRGSPNSPSPKAEMILDALEIGNGNWKTSIYYLQGMKEVAPNNPDILKALKYTREIQDYEMNKKDQKKDAAINKSVVDASINDDAKTAQFLTSINSHYIKDAQGAISTVINMRTTPQVRAESQKLIPAKQQNSVRTMVERIPPGRYFSNGGSTNQQERSAAPQGYSPPTSSSGGCPSRR